ncbi:MAG: hypothetical protein HGA44_21255 [Cellulomonadaceae bacterium]|nr:hypothetical protein [Cellulomonadaceae bacterium]
MSPELVVCAACGAAAGPGARFCEACGGDLPAGGQVVAPTGGAGSVDGAAAGPGGAVGTGAPVPGHAELSPEGAAPCRECGGAVDPDGYCTQCGAKAPRPRDHMVEAPQAWVGGVSDRGVRHHRNEDAMSTAADVVPGDRAVLVVCDGVSSSQDSDVASLAAARAARTVLLDGRAVGMGPISVDQKGDGILRKIMRARGFPSRTPYPCGPAG